MILWQWIVLTALWHVHVFTVPRAGLLVLSGRYYFLQYVSREVKLQIKPRQTIERKILFGFAQFKIISKNRMIWKVKINHRETIAQCTRQQYNFNASHNTQQWARLVLCFSVKFIKKTTTSWSQCMDSERNYLSPRSSSEDKNHFAYLYTSYATAAIQDIPPVTNHLSDRQSAYH